jgi:hypothetical protein
MPTYPNPRAANTGCQLSNLPAEVLGRSVVYCAPLLVKNPHYTPSKILSWDLDNKLGGKLVYGGDGYLVAKLAKCSR